MLKSLPSFCSGILRIIYRYLVVWWNCFVVECGGGPNLNSVCALNAICESLNIHLILGYMGKPFFHSLICGQRMWGSCRCDTLKHVVQTLSDLTLSRSRLLDICETTLCVAREAAALLRPPKAHRALPRRWVCLRWGAGTSSGSDWVSWHGRRANAGNKSVSLTWRLSSCDVPPCPHQFWTNKDVWEENKPSRQMSRWNASSVWRDTSGLRSPSGIITTFFFSKIWSWDII